MQIYFSPEVITPNFEVLNVVDSTQKAVGTVSLLFDEKKIYVYGILEEKGVQADFKDLLTPYLKGLSKAKGDKDIYSCLYIGCEKITLNKEESE